jgi:hypothetical protein
VEWGEVWGDGAWAGDKDYIILEVTLCLEEMGRARWADEAKEAAGWGEINPVPAPADIVYARAAEKRCCIDREGLVTV